MKAALVVCVAASIVLFVATVPLELSPVVGEHVCEPNSRFMRECNTCWCNAEGTEISCTRMECPPTSTAAPVETSARVCEPNTSRRVDCNTCTCNEHGTMEMCTLMGCINITSAGSP